MRIDSSTSPIIPPPPPSKYAARPEMRLLYDINPDLKRLSDRAMGRCAINLNRENQALTTWTKERLDAIEDASKAAASALSWSYLQKMGSTVLGLFNIIAGTSLIAAGQTGGKSLVASGVLGLTNAVMDEEGWDWVAKILTAQNEEARDKLRVALPIVSSMISMVLAAQGASQLSAHYDIEAILEKVMGSVNTALSLAKVPPAVKVAEADRKIITTEQNLSLHEKKADLIYKVLELLIQEFRRINDAAKKTIKDSIKATNTAALMG